MASKIRAIKCPQCGSTSQQSLKDNHYQCSSCGTEYYLDTDDVKIEHHHYEYKTSKPFINRQTLIGVVASVVFAAILATWGYFKTSSKYENARATSTNQSYQPPKKELKPVWHNLSGQYLLTEDRSQPWLVLTGQYDESGRLSTPDYDRMPYQIIFYNPVSGEQKIIKTPRVFRTIEIATFD